MSAERLADLEAEFNPAKDFYFGPVPSDFKIYEQFIDGRWRPQAWRLHDYFKRYEKAAGVWLPDVRKDLRVVDW